MAIDDIVAGLHRVNNVPRRIILGVLTAVIFLILASYFLGMLMGPALFFLTPAASFELNMGAFFMLAWSVFVVCFVLAWKLRESFHKIVGNVFSQPLSKIFSNWLFVMPLLTCILFSVVDLTIGLQDFFGVPTGALPTPRTDTEFFGLYIDLSYAPLIEEVGFRIIPTGTFLLTYLFLKKSAKSKLKLTLWQSVKLFFFSFLYPDGAKEIAGEKNVAVNGVLNGISRGEWIIVLITSIIFGVAHITSGIGWEVGKATSTFVQGFVFGIVYLAYGFQAPILMHWFFNYYFYTYELGARYYASISGINVWIETVTSTLGELLLIAFMILGLKRILSRRKKVTQKPSALPP